MSPVDKDVATNDYSSLSPEDLSLLKTRLQIYLLQKQVNDLAIPKKSLLVKGYEFLSKYIAWITGLIALIVGITKPASEYLEARKKAEVVSINNSILKLLDSSSAIKESTLLEVSTQPPDVVAPMLLFHLNRGKIDPNIATKIYLRMFELNRELSTEKERDKVIFHLLGQKDARDELLTQLASFALRDLNGNFPTASEDQNEAPKAKILDAYVDIITDKSANIYGDPVMQPVLDAFTKKCSDTTFKKYKICEFYNQTIH